MIQDLISGIRDAAAVRPSLRKMADYLRNVSFDVAILDDHAWMDRERLNFYQREFTALGFEPLGDFSPRSLYNATGFMHLMGHKIEKAHVSLHVAKPADGPPEPLRCAITCELSGGWCVGGTDREANPILYQLRMSRMVSLRDCDAAPASLWKQVQDIRDQLMKEEDLTTAGEVTFEDFKSNSARRCGEQAELLLRQSPLKFAIRRRTLMRQPPPQRELWTGKWTPQTPLK